MPRSDPQAARETAVKHLFRHLRDEQQLLRNPLVGPELLRGDFTARDLRTRIARAATIIREEDASLGRSERGRRQAACLLRCDLGSQSVASLADEFSISPRQLARDRREAWVRSLQHVLAKTAPLTAASIDDVVQNRVLALFRTGRESDAAAMMREHIARSPRETASFGLCSLALMQYDFKRGHDARETFAELQHRNPPAGRARLASGLSLALCLLNVLIEKADPTPAWTSQMQELARRAALETPKVRSMSNTILRLFLSVSKRFVFANDYRNTIAVCSALDEMTPSYEDLDSQDALALHALKAIREWRQNGFNVEMEAHMLRALNLAVSNGWTGVVAEGASLLASVYYLSGAIDAARSYRDLALSAVPLTDDKGAIALTYSNLATAALDSDCVTAAAQFSGLSFDAKRDGHPLLEHIPLVAAEVLVSQGHLKQGTARARDVLREAKQSGNQRLVAIAGRVVALGLEGAGEGQAAVAVMKQSFDLAVAGCCSKYDVHRIERSYRKIAHRNPLVPARQLTHQHFCG